MDVNEAGVRERVFPLADAARGLRPVPRRRIERQRMSACEAPPGRTLRGALRDLLTVNGRVSEPHLDTLLARISDATLTGIVLCDTDGRIVHINDYLCHLIGRGRGEVMGRPAVDYFGET